MTGASILPFMIGAWIGGVFFFTPVAVLVNLCTYARKTPEQRGSIFLCIVGLIVLLMAIRGLWLNALSLVAPALTVWWFYLMVMRRAEKKRANR